MLLRQKNLGTMYYMELQTSSQPPRSTAGLLGLLRANLSSVPHRPSIAASIAWATAPLLPRRLSSADLTEVAAAWRVRTVLGDLGAESVAQALESVAEQRARSPRSRIQSLGERLSGLMQLS